MSLVGLSVALFRMVTDANLCRQIAVISFPIVIAWKTKINLRQKLILTSVFLLVAFNIAVTIVRGSIFGDLYGTAGDANHKVLDTSWALFWFYMEYIVCKFQISSVKTSC